MTDAPTLSHTQVAAIRKQLLAGPIERLLAMYLKHGLPDSHEDT
jgi:hypothetical protein